MEKDLDWIRIRDLERMSGLSRRTIHFYVQSGLLHPPKRTGKTMAYYDEKHLKKLFYIIEEKKKGLPLTAIKDKIDDVDLELTMNSLVPEKTPASENKSFTNPRRTNKALGNKNRKSIIDLGCKLFLDKGLKETRVSDITKKLNIGKGTFYFYFSDKKELLLECIPLIFEKMFCRGWDEVRRADHPLERLKKRAKIVFPVLEEFCSIIQLTKEALDDNDPKIKKMGKKTYQSIRMPLESDIKKGISKGVFEEVDPKVASTLMLGMMENIYYLQTIDGNLDLDELWNNFSRLLTKGICKETGAPPLIADT